MLAFNSIQTFIVDAFAPDSAAGVAAANAVRAIVGCILPVFTAALFTNLGWGVGGTILGCLAAAAIPGPAIVGHRFPDVSPEQHR
jgi:hypothetical protein